MDGNIEPDQGQSIDSPDRYKCAWRPALERRDFCIVAAAGLDQIPDFEINRLIADARDRQPFKIDAGGEAKGDRK